MRRCAACGATAAWAWQPFGPGDTPATFTTLGGHYRGFPAVAICDDDRRRVVAGEPVAFRHRGKHYVAEAGEIRTGDLGEE